MYTFKQQQQQLAPSFEQATESGCSLGAQTEHQNTSEASATAEKQQQQSIWPVKYNKANNRAAQLAAILPLSPPVAIIGLTSSHSL